MKYYSTNKQAPVASLQEAAWSGKGDSESR